MSDAEPIDVPGGQITGTIKVEGMDELLNHLDQGDGAKWKPNIPSSWLADINDADDPSVFKVVLYAKEFTENTEVKEDGKKLLDSKLKTGWQNDLYINLWVNAYLWDDADLHDARTEKDYIGYGDTRYEGKDESYNNLLSMTELPALIQIHIPLTGTSLSNKQTNDLNIFRVHNGTPSELPAHPGKNSFGEFFEVSNNHIILHVRQFSDFSIASLQSSNNNNNNNNNNAGNDNANNNANNNAGGGSNAPRTGDDSNTVLWWGILLISVLGMSTTTIWYIWKRKSQKS